MAGPSAAHLAPASLLYLSHWLLELFLGLIKLRGRYQHETPGSRSPRSEMYVRHHAFSILALALLGFLVWHDGIESTPFGLHCSAVFTIFHGGAVFSFLYAYVTGAIPFGKVLVPHFPFFAGFLLHCCRVL